MRPAAADHRRDDLEVAQLLRLDRERVAVEDDEVGEQAGNQPSAPALVAGEERRCDARRVQRLLDRQRLLGTPGRPLVDRPQHPGGDPGDRVELLDRGIGAVRDQRAGVEQRAEGVRAVEPPGPEPVGEIAVRGCVRELDRAGDPELGEAREILRRQALRVLDPVPETPRLPRVTRRLERVERVPVRLVADRVDADRPAALGAAPDDLLELGTAS